MSNSIYDDPQAIEENELQAEASNNRKTISVPARKRSSLLNKEYTSKERPRRSTEK